MVELTGQNQELTRELNSRRQHREGNTEGHTQSQEDRRNDEPESQSRGTTSRRVPHLEKEMDQMRKVMDEMRENVRRTNSVEDLVHKTDSPFTTLINGHPLPPDEIMGRAFSTTLKGFAQVWFSKITPNSVSSFEELSKLFVNNFIGR